MNRPHLGQSSHYMQCKYFNNILLFVCTIAFLLIKDMFFSRDPRVNRNRDAFAITSHESETDSGVGVSAMEKRFAYSLLEKLLEYVDKAAYNMKVLCFVLLSV